MRRRNWYLLLATALLLLSAVLYLIHFAIFRDDQHIFIYLLGDLAFLPLEVLIVTLIIDSLLSEREKRATLEKMNMVIGAFFSEVGTELLRSLGGFDGDLETKRAAFAPDGPLEKGAVQQLQAKLAGLGFDLDSGSGDLVALKSLLVSKRDFMVRLLENPLLLEHESFTDLLWAVFHLTDELENRRDLGSLTRTDLDHLSGDMSRAYGRLVSQWVDYMGHLEKSYPYLFSLAMRLNPFDPEAAAEFN